MKKKINKILASIIASSLLIMSVPFCTINSASAADLSASITLDTANYIMDIGAEYDIGITIKNNGKTLSAAEVKKLIERGVLQVTDSRNGSVASLTQLSNGNFRVRGINYGTCYIVYDIVYRKQVLNHASVKIDVAPNVKAHGTAVRNTSLFTSKALVENGSTYNFITPDMAQNIVKTHANALLPRFDVTSLVEDDNIPYYEIAFTEKVNYYYYKINALTGDIMVELSYPNIDVSYPTISSSDARAIVLEDAKIKNPTDYEMSLSYFDDGLIAYNIKFNYEGYTYEYTLQAVDGAIVDSKYYVNENDPPKPENVLSESYIKKVVLNDIGVLAPEDTIIAGATTKKADKISTNLVYQSSRATYTVVVRVDKIEYTYTLNGYTGGIESKSQVVLDMISTSQAEQIALLHSNVNRLTVRELESFFTQNRDGYFYRVYFTWGDVRYSYVIDAVSGAIVDKKSEIIDAGYASNEEVENAVLANLRTNKLDYINIKLVYIQNEPKFNVVAKLNNIEYVYTIDAFSTMIESRETNRL